MEPKLNEEQQEIFDLLKTGQSMFITGSAGTGKSEVIKRYAKYAKEHNKNVVVTAPTGIAAINIEGATFHSTFKYPAKPIVKSDPEYRDIRVRYAKTWDYADIIIIDEISMLRVDVFDLFCMQLNDIQKRQNRNIQLIMLGDFFQLAPVITKLQKNVLLYQYPKIEETKGYAFTSEFWSKLGLRGAFLHKIIRQDDKEFIKNLELVKVGNVEGIRWVNNNAKISSTPDDKSIVLCSTKEEAERINSSRLEEIPSKSVTYSSKLVVASGYNVNENDLPTAIEVELKVGARVMCLVNNIDKKFQNGSLGTVIELHPNVGTIKVKFDNGNICELETFTWTIKKYDVDEKGKFSEIDVAEFSQIPVKLAYAITIHKSQGQTYDSVIIQPEKIFTPGQLYVALSRCRSIKGITLTSPIRENSRGLADPIVKRFYGVN